MKEPLTQSDLPAADQTLGGVCSPSGRRRHLRVRSYGLTDPGRKRSHNEDQFLVATLSKALQVQHTSLPQDDVYYSGPQGHLFLVADGVGGNAAGEKASALAVSVIENFVLDTLNWCLQLRSNAADALLAEFQQAMEQADHQLFHASRRQPELHGMGTTVTLAYCLGDQLFVAHVGDSRCYLLRRGLLYRLTHDHTLVAEMVQRGLLRPDEAAHHGYRHVITNVVGGSDPGVRVEVHKLPLESGDVLLLCSDGLTEMVSDQEILTVLQFEEGPAAATQRLVARANEQGGKDNVTVVVARFE
jgi:protein phosphatase